MSKDETTDDAILVVSQMIDFLKDLRKALKDGDIPKKSGALVVAWTIHSYFKDHLFNDADKNLKNLGVDEKVS